ncbi:unnamed protein product [Chrysodeixis includens]|uniref:Uncharacterized protein n=1 Tax=Chrysodeixis includens TaxID=689277 RepID=A0A9N8L809_CHRIL|nr:unnamed protein product [Chrysodeixis includens]
MSMNEGAALIFADEFKQTLDRYLFGICPQSFKMSLKGKNGTAVACDLDADQQDLAGSHPAPSTAAAHGVHSLLTVGLLVDVALSTNKRRLSTGGPPVFNDSSPVINAWTSLGPRIFELATLALRAHTAARSDCGRLGAALANTLGDLARTAANRQILAAAASNEQKKRKLSKSQKMKIQAKQRTALAVKKKAAAAAAAAAAKMAS